MFNEIGKGKWWDKGVNLVEGCDPVSAGCDNCWALAMNKRFTGTTEVSVHPERLEGIFKRRKPTAYSIWNDLFHPAVPFEFVDKLMAVIALCQQHTFQCLTKRDEIMLEYRTSHFDIHNIAKIAAGMVEDGDFHYDKIIDDYERADKVIPNLWLGVTVERPDYKHRIDTLRKIPAAVRFVSIEPMLGAVKLRKGKRGEITEFKNGVPEMNNNLEHFNTDLCEKLFDFIYPDEADMTKKEVQAELQHLNIDIRPVKRKLELTLNAYYETQKAKVELKNAREKRLSLLEKIKQVKMPNLPTLRNELQDLIAQHLSVPLQVTYFRKLESAATEQDLQSLLKDIILLESLDKDVSNEE